MSGATKYTSGRRQRRPGEEQAKRVRRRQQQAQYENLRSACERATSEAGSDAVSEVSHLGLRLALRDRPDTMASTTAPCGLYETLAVVRTRRYGLALALLFGDTPDRRAMLYLSGGRRAEIIHDTTTRRSFVAAYVVSVRTADGEPLPTLRAVEEHLRNRASHPAQGTGTPP